VKDNLLTIEGKTEEKHEEKDKNYIHSEIKRGSFSRSITLPDSVDDEKIVAKYKDGVLNITIPKSNKTKSRQIIVQS
jgi:HSP20 family protein